MEEEMKNNFSKALLLFLGVFLFACGGEELVKKDADQAAQRKDFIKTSEKKAAAGIVQLDADIVNAKQWNLKQLKLGANANKDVADESQLKLELVKKIRPAEEASRKAKANFESAKKDRAEFESRLDESSLPEFDQYKENMTTILKNLAKADADLKKAMDDFKKEYQNLK